MNIQISERKHLTVKVSKSSYVAVQQEAHYYSAIQHETPCTPSAPFIVVNITHTTLLLDLMPKNFSQGYAE